MHFYICVCLQQVFFQFLKCYVWYLVIVIRVSLATHFISLRKDNKVILKLPPRPCMYFSQMLQLFRSECHHYRLAVNAQRNSLLYSSILCRCMHVNILNQIYPKHLSLSHAVSQAKHEVLMELKSSYSSFIWPPS